MALCVSLKADGTLVATGQGVSDCTGYVLVSGSEYGVYQLVQRVFEVPDMKTVIQTSTAVAFTVIGWYVAARIIGTVATFFDSR
ncbi:hypothetical protein XfCFBP8356_009445 [Xylella fastidiosa subsp. sandyi]|uniref:hypothetical protein n=1 Tax=Xylella fastidiosa TaxID=2371 RepID=UPI000707C68A|nr:hypothetical protein [Xylella fastidiosa]KQH72875.1 hypothetical protein AOT81_11425 [Xylella fastidiosa]RWA43498.1 hypothetical protein XfCFBP8356_11580 [Xylella fastidiosa subsp. sandyi]WNY20008.1 hypothetical protein RO839_05215 [Xylella fastidiosa]WNY22304.1 hypothetical protein RO838_05230 [Xylella fastidiosa]